MAEKVVWMTVTKACAEISADVDHDNGVLSVEVTKGTTVKQMSAKVRKLLELDQDDLGIVLQLRNSRGSLVPLNGKLESNSKDTPYSLLVLREYQTAQPKSTSVRADSLTSTILSQTQIFLSRISNLENSIPELKVKTEEKIKQEMHELEDKLNFLQKRFNEADQTEWTGIIKKSPLW